MFSEGDTLTESIVNAPGLGLWSFCLFVFIPWKLSPGHGAWNIITCGRKKKGKERGGSRRARDKNPKCSPVGRVGYRMIPLTLCLKKADLSWSLNFRVLYLFQGSIHHFLSMALYLFPLRGPPKNLDPHPLSSYILLSLEKRVGCMG